MRSRNAGPMIEHQERGQRVFAALWCVDAAGACDSDIRRRMRAESVHACAGRLDPFEAGRARAARCCSRSTRRGTKQNLDLAKALAQQGLQSPMKRPSIFGEAGRLVPNGRSESSGVI